MRTAPDLSVVIPTFERADRLPRAIDSALGASPDGSGEVVVVPNGDGEDWKAVALRYAGCPRVRWSPIGKANANAARNHGLAVALGDMIRFLDDDDYLYPDECRKQHQALLESGFDVSSAALDVVTDQGELIHVFQQPRTADYVVAVLGPSRMTGTSGHIYKRSILQGLAWDECIPIRQDMAWAMQLAGAREVSWVRSDAAVGAWVQHSGPRISRGRDPGRLALELTAKSIEGVYAQLLEQQRLNAARGVAAADGLWASLQKGLQYDYRFWRRVARVAEEYAGGRRPPSRIHRIAPFKFMPAFNVEVMLIPIRFLFRPIRRLMAKFGLDYV